MSEKFKCIMAVLVTLSFLATLPAPAFAQRKAWEGLPFHEEYINALNTQQRITLVSAYIDQLKKTRKEVEKKIGSIKLASRAGLITSPGDAAIESLNLERAEYRLDLNIRNAQKVLKALKEMDASDFTKIKAKMNTNMQLGAEYRQVSQAHREARKADSMKQEVAMHNLHLAVFYTRLLMANNLAIISLARNAFDMRIKATRGSEGGGGSNCFVAGTLVLMSDGSFKPIEDVQVGDKVFSRDARSGEDVVAEVYKLLRGTETAVYKFDDGLQVNADHRFYTDKGTVMAGNLKPGTVLLGRDGSRTLCSIDKQGPVLATTEKDAMPSIPVYNIMVRGTHTFFVSPDGNNTYMVLDISACGK